METRCRADLLGAVSPDTNLRGRLLSAYVRTLHVALLQERGMEKRRFNLRHLYDLYLYGTVLYRISEK